MIFGLPISTFTLVHVVLSLVGIAAGIVVLLGMLRGSLMPGLTAIFLSTTILTSITGFMFPNSSVTPGQIVGGISLAVLAVAFVSRYPMALAGPWRWIYVATATLALYLNCFVGVVQAFQKFAPLQALAPTQSEPPFVAAQAATLLIFAGLGFLAIRRFHPVAN